MKKPTALVQILSANPQGLPSVPKHTQGRIYWNKEKNRAWVWLLVGYCPDTLAYYMMLYAHALKTFPNIKWDNLTCGKILKSSSIQGFTFLMFPVDMPHKTFDGYHDMGTAQIDFSY